MQIKESFDPIRKIGEIRSVCIIEISNYAKYDF